MLRRAAPPHSRRLRRSAPTRPLAPAVAERAATIGAMDLRDWLAARDGIGHRGEAARAGFAVSAVRNAIRTGAVTRIRRSWVALDSADPVLRAAAGAGGKVTCVSAARRKGWWVPEGEASALHLHVPPHAASTGLGSDFAGVVHWTVAIASGPPHTLVDSIEDVLEHVARCLDPESALVVWESALRTERLSVEAVRRTRWLSRSASRLAQQVAGLSDSGLETIFVVRLSGWGLPIRQQIAIAGHRVDVLIGDRLVVQLDGFAFHSTAAQRTRDAAHDAELRLRGYTVLRFTYAQVVHDWPGVERVIARALAAGAHRA